MDKLYLLSGKVLHLIQTWENEFKLLTIKHNIEKSDDKRSLSNMNSFLLREKVINEKQFLTIKEIIEIRNFIIHRLFISLETLSQEELNDYLNNAVNKINESLLLFKEQ